jgi:hypothetical protein
MPLSVRLLLFAQTAAPIPAIRFDFLVRATQKGSVELALLEICENGCLPPPCMQMALLRMPPCLCLAVERHLKTQLLQVEFAQRQYSHFFEEAGACMTSS